MKLIRQHVYRYHKLLEEGVLMDTYTLLEIATSKLLENTRFIFDPRHEDAVYTMANIPPTAISVYKT